MEQNYVNSGGMWMHIDMAGPAWAGERGTGYGVALLFGLANAVSSTLPAAQAV
jgi:leucyl aminopeptidase